MLCPICNTEMMIDHTKFLVEGDESKETETKLFNLPIVTCNNPNCSAFREEREGEPIPLALSHA